MSDNLYFNKYFIEKNIVNTKDTDKLYDISVKLHATEKDKETGQDSETIFTLTPKGLKGYDEDLKPDIFDVASNLKIIYDELSFFDVAGTQIKLFDLFKKTPVFYKFFTDPSLSIFSETDETKKIEQYKKFKEIFIYKLNKSAINGFNTIDNKEQLKNILETRNPPIYMLLLYSFVRAFYNLELQETQKPTNNITNPIESIHNKIAKDIYGLNINYYSTERDRSYNPKQVLLPNTIANIEKTEKSKYYDEDDVISDNADLITFYNVHKLLTYILKKGEILQLTRKTKDENIEADYEILKSIQFNEKYKKLFSINHVTKTITVHFDIELKKVSKTENLHIIMDLRGDITENNVKYLPKYSDPKYSKYEQILITSNYQFRDRFLNLTKFKAITDKNEFFFDEDYFKLLLKEMEKSSEKSDELKRENIKRNMDYIIKRLFTTSTTIKPKNRGHLEYKGKQYMINGYAGDIEYVHGGEPALSAEEKYKQKEVDFSAVRIDFNDYQRLTIKDNPAKPKYDIMDNIFIKKGDNDPIPINTTATNKIKNIDINTGYITYDISKNGAPTEERTPIKNVIIKGSRKNIQHLNTNKIQTLIYNGRKIEFITLNTVDISNQKVRLLDKTVQNMVLKTGKDKTYKIKVPLLLLDKSQPITMYRRLMNRDCDGACKKIDKTLTSIFFPTATEDELKKNKIQFFEKFFKQKAEFDKYGDIEALVKKKNPVSREELTKSDKSETSNKDQDRDKKSTDKPKKGGSNKNNKKKKTKKKKKKRNMKRRVSKKIKRKKS